MGKFILVVDHTATLRHIAGYTLKKGGYEVVEAEDGITGLAALKNNKIDLIISDLDMPNMDGLEMVKNIKTDRKLKDIPIFMLTTNASAEAAHKGKSLGVTAWIVKPFVPDKLLEAVNKLLKNKK
ncbi:MAG: response regulator [Bdellovibrionota bacterium]